MALRVPTPVLARFNPYSGLMTMISREAKNPLLAPLVDRLWYCEVPGAAGQETVLPTGRAQLVIGLDPDHALSVIQGPTTRPRTIEAAAQRRAVGVSFRLGALASCCPADGTALTDQLVDLDQLWGSGFRSLGDELCELTTADQVFDRLELVLGGWAARYGGVVAPDVVSAAARLEAQRPVADVAAALDVDRRRLGQRFKASVGFGMKHYGRLRRFELALRSLRSADPPPLSQVAADLGYADQSHLTRDFRHFAGRPPAELHGDGSPSPTHIVD